MTGHKADVSQNVCWVTVFTTLRNGTKWGKTFPTTGLDKQVPVTGTRVAPPEGARTGVREAGTRSPNPKTMETLT
jgi:hypothetical protein